MGADLKSSGKTGDRLIKELLEDLDPKVKESVQKLIDNYEGEELDRKLSKLMDIKKTMKFVEMRE